MLGPTTATVWSGAMRPRPRQQLGEHERVPLDVVGRVGEVEHDRVVAARAQVLDQVLLVEQRVELVPAHRVVDVEALGHDDRVRDVPVPGAR